MNATTATKAPVERSLFWRLRHTPLGDLLRGRLTARLDIRAAIAQAGLPQQLAEKVWRVVRRTRLSRRERVAVACELSAHFQDGLEAESNPDALALSFGDERQAARLIRRAVLRARALPWRVARRLEQLTVALLLLLVVVYAGLAIRLYAGAPVVLHDYWADFDARAAQVPNHQRAWPLYREAEERMGDDGWPSFTSRWQPAGPTDPEWASIVTALEAHQDALQLLRQGAAQPALGYVMRSVTSDTPEMASAEREATMDAGAVQDNPPLITAPLSYLQPMARGGRMLAADARLGTEQRDAKRVVADLEALLGMSEQLADQPFLISDILSAGLLNLSASALGTQLNVRPDLLSDTQLVRLAHQLGAVRGGGRLRIRWAGERAFFHDMIQRLYTDDGRGNGYPAPNYLGLMSAIGADARYGADWNDGMVGGLVMPVIAVMAADRRTLLDKYEHFLDLAKLDEELPLWERESSRADQEVTAFFSHQESMRYMPVKMLMPTFTPAAHIMETVTQMRDAALTAVALELYRRRTGNWPEHLDDLVPDLLPQVPRDRLDGHTLKYRLVDDRPLLYSVGADRDDDGGRLPAGDGTAAQRNKAARDYMAANLSPDGKIDPDGDWILWPPVSD